MTSSWFLGSVLLFLSNVVLSHQAFRDTSSTVVHKWRAAEFNYPNEKAKNDAIKRKQFILNNAVILDCDYHATTKRYFVATPMFASGIPATLSEVTKEQGEPLKPFPNWPQISDGKPSCQGPFSVYRFHIDKCGLLWAVDSGRWDIFNTSQQACPPKLLVYDLNRKDREILRYEFPTGTTTERSVLINIVTESYRSDCSDSFAYISDVNDHGMIVFDFARRSSWRIEHKYFYPYPTEVTMVSNSVTFDLTDGLFGLAVGPTSESQRKLYFHAFASIRESWVPLNVLKNQTMARDPNVGRTLFVNSPGTRAAQSTVEVMTDEGVLIYALITMNAIACWNHRKPYTIENQYILERDNENFQFISGMKYKDNKLFIMSSRLQNYIAGNINTTDYKYRIILIEDVRRLLQNTPCTSGSSSGSEDEYLGSGSVQYPTNGGTTHGGSGGSHNHGGSHGYHHGGSHGNSYGGSSNNGGSYSSHSPTPSPSSEVVFKPRGRQPAHAKDYGYNYAQGRFGDSSETAGQPDETNPNNDPPELANESSTTSTTLNSEGNEQKTNTNDSLSSRQTVNRR